MFIAALHIVFFIGEFILPISSQSVEGRYLRPNRPKCDPQNGCSSAGGFPLESDDKNYRHDAADGYRSVGVDGRPNANKDFKKDSDIRSGSVKFDDSDYKPERVYNLNPPIDKIPYIPKPVDDAYPPLHTKDDASSIEISHNPKPVRGSDRYNPKPIADPNLDQHKPKQSGVGSSGYNPRPDRYVPRPADDEYPPKPIVDPNSDPYKPKPSGIGSSGYNPRPDRYVPRPVDDEYPPKPLVNPNSDPYKPKPSGIGSSGYNPRPDRYVPRPVDDKYHPKPDVSGEEDSYRPVPDHRPRPGSRPRPDPARIHEKPVNPPDVPDYPNKDLGGYHDPKDDDYNGDPGVSVGEYKPLPGNNCVCVPYYQCREGHIVTDGAGIIDARKKPEPEDELPLDGKFKPPTCGPFHVCCNTPETSTVTPYEHRCGVRNPSGINSRILSPSNKGEADFGEWPWQAAVLKSEGKVNIFMCGGVLIDKFHVLTVAHCVFHLYKYDDYPLKVRLGEWDTQTTSEFLAHEDYRVSKIIVHPEFKNTSLWNDVAILRLEEAVLFAPHIDTICLPKYDEIFDQQNCVVTGWGKDAYKGGTFSNIMKEVALQVIDNYQCEEMLRKTRLGRFFQLHDGFLCAGGEYGLDSCKGDGGGPLVCYRKDKSYALAGIVSWGIDCGQPGVPGVYVKIQKYLDWISKTTGVYLEDYWPKH